MQNLFIFQLERQEVSTTRTVTDPTSTDGVT